MQKREAAVIALLGGLLVFALKLLAYFISGSVALLSDALESIINIVASAMMLVSIIISARPADENHNYGHNKAENLSCFVEGILIVIAAFLIAETAIGRLWNPTVLTEINLAIFVSITATACNFLISWSLIRVSKKTGSIALEGDAKHIFSDVLSTLGVLVGLTIVSITGWSILDPIMALGVAALIVRMGLSLLLKSSKDLMDQSCPEEETRIRTLLTKNKERFIDFHCLRTRKSGSMVFVEFHLCVKESVSTKDAHDLSDDLEAQIKKEVPNAEVLIHVEPNIEVKK
jgi:cation diffusion facilitator family transporter